MSGMSRAGLMCCSPVIHFRHKHTCVRVTHPVSTQDGVFMQALQEEALLSFSSGQKPFGYNWMSPDMMQAHHTSFMTPVFG